MNKADKKLEADLVRLAHANPGPLQDAILEVLAKNRAKQAGRGKTANWWNVVEVTQGGRGGIFDVYCVGEQPFDPAESSLEYVMKQVHGRIRKLSDQVHSALMASGLKGKKGDFPIIKGSRDRKKIHVGWKSYYYLEDGSLTADALLEMIEASGARAYLRTASDKKAGRPTIACHATKQGLFLWVQFSGYGRVHHVTGNLSQWEKAMMTARGRVMAELEDTNQSAKQYSEITPLYYEVGEVYVDGLKSSPRDLIMSTWFKARPQWGPEEIHQALTAAEMAGIRTQAPMPS